MSRNAEVRMGRGSHKGGHDRRGPGGAPWRGKGKGSEEKGRAIESLGRWLRPGSISWLPMVILCTLASYIPSFKCARSLFLVNRSAFDVYRTRFQYIWETIISGWWPFWSMLSTGSWVLLDTGAQKRNSLIEKLEVYKARGGTPREQKNASNLIARLVKPGVVDLERFMKQRL